MNGVRSSRELYVKYGVSEYGLEDRLKTSGEPDFESRASKIIRIFELEQTETDISINKHRMIYG